MGILKRIFITIVPWYNESEQIKRDERSVHTCDSARKAIIDAETVVIKYRSGSIRR